MMPEQEIGYCTASDGVRIAYATLGNGPPLVYAAGWPVHLEIEWQKPFVRRFLEGIADGLTLIRYDMRGSGLSDRDVSDLSQEALSRDLQAVIDHLGLERFALMSLGDMAGPISICYVVEHPDKVSHLVLNSSYLQGADLSSPERRKALVDYVANFGYPTFNLLEDPAIGMEQQLGVLEINEEAASYAVQAEILKTYFAADVTAVVSRVDVPTLVLHARGDPLVPFERGVELAERLPQAEFVAYDGASAVPWVISRLLVREVHRFLGVADSVPDIAGTVEYDRPAASCRLTRREMEVLTMLAAGKSNRLIAEELVLSVRTVERHIANIYAKLRLDSRVQAAAYALEQGLVSAHEALRSARRLAGNG